MEKPPESLYHYTSPGGIIGIITSEKIWATNIRYLNDFKELVEASDIALTLLSDFIQDTDYSDLKELLIEMREKVGTTASRYYVCSFSEDKDSLSQWRAYCPPTGGYALGIPSAQLSLLAQESNWYFVKCVYDESLSRKIIKEIIESFLNEYRKIVKKHQSEDIPELNSKVVSNFQLYIAKIGGVIKNKAFEREEEWRLISPAIVESDRSIKFRVGKSGVIPYFEFPLITAENPNWTNLSNTSLKLTVGPNPQPDAEAKLAAQYLLTRYLDISSGIVHSAIPYRSW
jgi:hypothetical protein